MTAFLRSRAAAAALGAALAGGLLVVPVVVASSSAPATAAEPCASPSADPNPLPPILPLPSDSASPSASAASSPTPCPTPSASASASASASVSPSASASGSPSASGCPSPSEPDPISSIVSALPFPGSSASPSATPTATTSPSGSPSPCSSGSPSPQSCPSQPLTVRVNTPTINATGNASVTVTGATPSATIELQGYSQNHENSASFANDPTPVDRTATADSNGAATFNDLKPASNTRVRARQAGCAYGNSAVIEVRAQETLAVKRIGVRQYTFSGRSIPARPGGLIVSLYRIVGSSCRPGVEPSQCPGEKFVAQARAAGLGAPNQGLYSITVTFPSSDSNVRDEFVVKTGRDAQNAPGRSNARSLLIY